MLVMVSDSICKLLVTISSVVVSIAGGGAMVNGNEGKKTKEDGGDGDDDVIEDFEAEELSKSSLTLRTFNEEIGLGVVLSSPAGSSRLLRI